MNPKGGTYSRVLAQLLSSYVERLYPDARDQVGCRVLLKIDGGPGRLDLNSLAELRSRGVYLSLGLKTPPMSHKRLTRIMVSSSLCCVNIFRC